MINFGFWAFGGHFNFIWPLVWCYDSPCWTTVVWDIGCGDDGDYLPMTGDTKRCYT